MVPGLFDPRSKGFWYNSIKTGKYTTGQMQTLVDYTNVLRRRDKLPLREAVELAGRTRLRPILMTSIATALGLVPMSLGIGEGSELQVPLARVVIGGLTTSLLITLVLVPTVYTLFEEGWRGLWVKHSETEAQA